MLGQGAFGEVRKCINRHTKVIRAVKLIKKESMNKEEEESFKHEITILKKLDHPNILKLYEVFEDEKRYYLVTELCKGGELFDEIVTKVCFSEKEAAAIIQQILQAVAYCHDLGIVHRDLKPENVLIDKELNNTLKIIDFGTSTIYDKSSGPLKTTHGTSYYIAPEVLNKRYDDRCDVWSIGVILYILLSGKPPFDGDNDEEITE
jgi:calcium-dependent protein kinase